MVYSPIARDSQASSAFMNARLQEGIIRVSDATALAATLSHSLPPADGTWVFQTDVEVIKQKAASSWNDVLNVRRARTMAAPDLDFISGTTEQGTLTMSLASGVTTLAALTSASQRFFEARRATDGTLEIRAQTATGMKLQSLTRTNQLSISDNGASLTTGGTLAFQAATINFRATGSGGPLIAIDGTSAGASRSLGTDASGALIAFPRPTSYPSWLPQSIPGTAQPGDGWRLNDTRTAMEFGAVAASGGGFDETTVTLTAIGSGSSTTSPAIALPADYATDNEYVYMEVTANSRIGSARLRVDYLSTLTGNSFVEVGSIAIRGYSTGRIQFNPTSRQLRVVASNNPAITYLSLINFGASGGGGSSTFLGLLDTPSAFTADRWLKVNSAGDAIEEVDAPSFSVGDDSIVPSMLRADTAAQRQSFYQRLHFPYHETITTDSFVLNAGVPTTGGLTGFLTSPLAGNINGSPSGFNVRLSGTLYQITGLYQITIAGGTQWNVVLRFNNDPDNAVNGDWQLQIDSVLFNFSDATKNTAPVGTTYTWTGNSSNLLIGGQSYNCALRIPIADQFVVAPINFSQLEGTAAPDQFRDNSIVPTRLIGGTLQQQAQLRSKAGFAAFVNSSTNVLKFSNGQVIQEALDITSLSNFVPSAEPSAGVDPQLMKWGPGGLNTISRLLMTDLPNPGNNNAGRIIEWDGTRWTDVPTPTAGMATTATWSTLGRMPATFANMPSVSATDDGKFLGVAGGDWSLFAPPLSGFSGSLPFSRLSGTASVAQIPSAIPFDRLDLDTTAKKAAARTLLEITTGGASTPANDSITRRMIDIYTGAGATDPIDDASKRAWQDLWGVNDNHGLSVLHSFILTTAHPLGGNRGYSLAGAGYGTLSDNTFVVDTQTLTIVILNQISDGLLEFAVHGTLPSNFQNDYGLEFRNATTGAVVGVVRFKDARRVNEPGDTAFPQNLRSFVRFRWSGQNTDLIYSLAANSTVNVAVSAPLPDILDELSAGFRQLPAYPTGSEKRGLAGFNGSAEWNALRSTFEEAAFTYTISSAQRTNQDPVTVSPTVLTANAALFSVSGQVITVQQDGNYNFVLIAQPRASNEGAVRFFLRRNNRDVQGSPTVFGDDMRGLSAGKSTFHVALSRNDRILLQYVADEVSPSSGTSPAPISGATGTQYSSRNYTLISWTAPTTNTYDLVHYRSRPAGQSGTEWGERQTVWANVNSIRVPWLSDDGVDVQVWLEDTHSTTGGFSRTATYIHSSGTFTTESARQQTVDAIIDVIVGRSDTEFA